MLTLLAFGWIPAWIITGIILKRARARDEAKMFTLVMNDPKLRLLETSRGRGATIAAVAELMKGEKR